MQLNYDSQILNLKGHPFADPDSSYSKIYEMILNGVTLEQIKTFCQQKIDENLLTLGGAIVFAINNSKEDKKNGQDSYKAYKLAQKVENQEQLTVDEVSRIKTIHVEEIFKHNSIILGFIWDSLENT